jgi:hypothetical protein
MNKKEFFMRNVIKLIAITVLVAVIGFSFVTCDTGGGGGGGTPGGGGGPYVITIAAINGVTAPIEGGTPVTAITQTAQYTGTVTWAPAVSGTFAANTAYTATITLTAKTGYTLQGVASNFFTVAGATASNVANSGSITAVFPKTGGTAINPVTIDIAAIGGVSIPATGGIPVTTISENAQYSGTVAWNGNSSAFAADTAYTATITLTAKTGYTLQGVASNFFTVLGATTITNSVNSGVITVIFPPTAATVFDNVTALAAHLSSLPYNTADTPYTIVLNVSDLTNLKTTLNNNLFKYVNLDLSGSTITTIPDNAFDVCRTLTGITIPNTVTSIGGSAFNNCTNLASVTIPNSVTSIGGSAFNNCTSLTSVTIPNSVTSIGQQAFSYCTSLAGITIPNSVTRVRTPLLPITL